MAHASRRSVALALVVSLVAACGTSGPSAVPPTSSAAPGASTSPGGSGGQLAIPSLANVTLATALSVRAVVGPTGGNLQTTGPDGVLYTLKVPQGALLVPTEVVMVPLEGTKDLPDGVTLAGGVHLLPEGLRPVIPMSLDMRVTVPAGKQAAPFAYTRDLVNRHPYPARSGDPGLTFTVTHFSGYGALLETEIAQAIGWFPPPTPGGEAQLRSLMTELGSAAPGPGQEDLEGILRDWLEEVIRPAADSVLQRDFELAWIVDPEDAVARSIANLMVFRVALAHVALETGSTFPAIDAAFQSLTVRLFEHLLGAANRSCAAHPDLALNVIVMEIVAWRARAEWLLTAAQVPESLTVPRLEAELCVRASLDTATGLTFPTEILAGQRGTLSVRAGYTLPGGQPRFDAPMSIVVQATNAEPPTATGTTSPDAPASFDVAWTMATDRLQLIVTACIASLFAVGVAICEERTIERGQSAPQPSCPTFTVTAGPETATSDNTWRSISASYSPSEGFAGAGLGGNFSVSLGAAGSSASARGDARFIVDSSSAGGGSQNVAITWFGTGIHRPAEGTASGTVTLTINGTAATTAFSGSTGDRNIRVSVPLMVEHGDVISAQIAVSISSSSTKGDYQVTGSVEFATAPSVSIRQSECATS